VIRADLVAVQVLFASYGGSTAAYFFRGIHVISGALQSLSLFTPTLDISLRRANVEEGPNSRPRTPFMLGMVSFGAGCDASD
jgi:hypothetical protein